MTASGAFISKLHSAKPEASKGAKVQSESCQAAQYMANWFDQLPLQAGHEAIQTRDAI